MPDSSIGGFAIGESPIEGGGITPVPPDTTKYAGTIINQYANSPNLFTLVTNFASYIDQTGNMDSFFDMVWNLDTAQGNGLDIWGRIVDISRVLQVSVGNNLGFTDGVVSSGDPFNISPFYSGAPLTNNYALSDDAYRVLIYAKALANISDGSIASINQILLTLFPGRGNCYVQDNLDMTMTYVFMFTLTNVEIAVIAQSGVLPKPTGVEVNYVII